VNVTDWPSRARGITTTDWRFARLIGMAAILVAGFSHWQAST